MNDREAEQERKHFEKWLGSAGHREHAHYEDDEKPRARAKQRCNGTGLKKNKQSDEDLLAAATVVVVAICLFVAMYALWKK